MIRMRTTLDLPETLVEDARTALGYKSKTDTVVFALKEVVRRSKLDDLKALFGKVTFEVDPRTLRGKAARRAAK
jgi:Arc/MetJ family transcription regulator